MKSSACPTKWPRREVVVKGEKEEVGVVTEETVAAIEIARRAVTAVVEVETAAVGAAVVVETEVAEEAAATAAIVGSHTQSRVSAS